MPKRLILGLLMLPLLLSVAGCGHIRYRSALPPSGRVYQQRHNFFLGGLIGDAWIHLPSICPQGVHTLDVYHSLGNLFFSALTLGIYMPTSARIHCAAAGGAPGSVGRADRPPGTAQDAAVQTHGVASVQHQEGE
jgi:hypothetical protein